MHPRRVSGEISARFQKQIVEVRGVLRLIAVFLISVSRQRRFFEFCRGCFGSRNTVLKSFEAEMR